MDRIFQNAVLARKRPKRRAGARSSRRPASRCRRSNRHCGRYTPLCGSRRKVGNSSRATGSAARTRESRSWASSSAFTRRHSRTSTLEMATAPTAASVQAMTGGRGSMAVVRCRVRVDGGALVFQAIISQAKSRPDGAGFERRNNVVNQPVLIDGTIQQLIERNTGHARSSPPEQRAFRRDRRHHDVLAEALTQEGPHVAELVDEAEILGGLGHPIFAGERGRFGSGKPLA